MNLAQLLTVDRESQARHTMFFLSARNWSICRAGWRRIDPPPMRCVVFEPRNAVTGAGYRIHVQPLETAG